MECLSFLNNNIVDYGVGALLDYDSSAKPTSPELGWALIYSSVVPPVLILLLDSRGCPWFNLLCFFFFSGLGVVAFHVENEKRFSFCKQIFVTFSTGW